MYVVDASVAVKWLVPEEGRPEAKALLDGGELLAAPELIVAEVASGIARKARLGQIPRDSLGGISGMWLRLLRSGVLELVASL